MVKSGSGHCGSRSGCDRDGSIGSHGGSSSSSIPCPQRLVTAGAGEGCLSQGEL